MALVEHLEKLRHFKSVASYSSVSKAAQSTGLSQAGLSKSISNLESVLGVSLFFRSKDGLVLTKEGELLLASTRRILDEAFQIETTLRSTKVSQIPAKVKIGMYDSLAIYFFPDLISYTQVIYPEVEFELTVRSSSALSEMVERGKLDLTIGATLDRSQKPGTEHFRLFTDQYSLYISPKLRSDGLNLPIVFHPEAVDETSKTIEEHVSSVLKKRIAHRVYNFETIKTLTVQGLGIGVLPTRVANPLVRRSELRPYKISKFPEQFGLHSIGFLTSKKFSLEHRDFVSDIFRLGEMWTIK